VSLLRLYSGFKTIVPFGRILVSSTVRFPPTRRSKTSLGMLLVMKMIHHHICPILL
jgi:hypothetical protein